MKIRIAVAVNAVGGWAALGGFGVPDQGAMEAVSSTITAEGTGVAVVHWIEADVPGPAEPLTIIGAITEPSP